MVPEVSGDDQHQIDDPSDREQATGEQPENAGSELADVETVHAEVAEQRTEQQSDQARTIGGLQRILRASDRLTASATVMSIGQQRTAASLALGAAVGLMDRSRGFHGIRSSDLDDQSWNAASSIKRDTR